MIRAKKEISSVEMENFVVALTPVLNFYREVLNWIALFALEF
jgi:hypothetical protein